MKYSLQLNFQNQVCYLASEKNLFYNNNVSNNCLMWSVQYFVVWSHRVPHSLCVVVLYSSVGFIPSKHLIILSRHLLDHICWITFWSFPFSLHREWLVANKMLRSQIKLQLSLAILWSSFLAQCFGFHSSQLLSGRKKALISLLCTNCSTLNRPS